MNKSLMNDRDRAIASRGNHPADHDTQVWSNERQANAYRDRQLHPGRWVVSHINRGRWSVWYAGARHERLACKTQRGLRGVS